jgi:hypothetical protein
MQGQVDLFARRDYIEEMVGGMVGEFCEMRGMQ